MTLKPVLHTLLGVLCCLQFAYPQCITPTVSFSGTFCIGSQLRLNSNIVPSSVTWSLGGNTLATQTGTFSGVSTVAAGGNGLGSNANQLYWPAKLFVTADGTMYIPDSENDRVQKWLPGATSGITVAGGNGRGKAANQFNRPTAVFIDQQGNLYVTDQNNDRVQKFAPGATQGVTVAGDPNGNPSVLYHPTDVWVTSNGDIYVCDQWNHVVSKYPPGGAVVGQVVAGVKYSDGKGANQLWSPNAMYIDGAGNIYICDLNNSRVQKWAPGAISGVTFARGYAPMDICADCNGNIYVEDGSNHRIMKYDAQGIETVLVGAGDPNGIATSGNNEIFVSDRGNLDVLKFSATINPVFTPTAKGTYTVTANYNCCPPYVKTFDINTGTAELSITATNTTICPGEPVTFTSQNVSQLTTPVYQWNVNGINVGSNSDIFTTTTLQGNDKVVCNISGLDVCGTNATASSNALEIKIRDTLLPDLGPDVGICPGGTTLLKTSRPYTAYVWQDNSTGPELSINAPGKYYVTVQDQCNRTFSDTLSAWLFEIDNNILSADTTICYYETPIIKPVKELTSFYWSDQTTGSTTTISQPGLYWLEAKDVNGCTVRDSINIYSKTCPPRGIYMPNAFTPDNNGRNDWLKPVIYGTIKKYRFSVFNRYGQMVFNTTDPARGWNGTVNNNYPNAGTYVWYCTYEVEGKKLTTEKGAVLLIK